MIITLSRRQVVGRGYVPAVNFKGIDAGYRISHFIMNQKQLDNPNVLF